MAGKDDEERRVTHVTLPIEDLMYLVNVEFIYRHISNVCIQQPDLGFRIGRIVARNSTQEVNEYIEDKMNAEEWEAIT